MTSPPIENLHELEQELGDLRYRCEVPLRKSGTFDLIASAVVMYFVAVLISGIVIALPLDFFGAPRRVIQVATFSFALLIDIIVMRAIINHVSKDYLCLFEDGFAVRIGSRRRQFRFDEIDQIGFGQLLTKLEKKLQGIGYLAYAVKPSLKSLHDQSAKNMITVTLKSGKRRFVRGVLVKFDKEQTREFFRILLEERPELWEPPETA